MTSRKFNERDFLDYSLSMLKYQDNQLNQFIETFCHEGTFNGNNLVKTSTDLIAWGIFSILISVISFLVIFRGDEIGIQIQHLLFLIFLVFVYYKLINRIIKYPENKAIYRFLKSEFYTENRGQLSKAISLIEKEEREQKESWIRVLFFWKLFSLAFLFIKYYPTQSIWILIL